MTEDIGNYLDYLEETLPKQRKKMADKLNINEEKVADMMIETENIAIRICKVFTKILEQETNKISDRLLAANIMLSVAGTFCTNTIYEYILKSSGPDDFNEIIKTMKNHLDIALQLAIKEREGKK